MEFSAAVLRVTSAPITIERVRLVDLRPKDVLVKVNAAGLCHTDWEAASSEFGTTPPVILGHECAGVVEDVGSEVSSLCKGDHVVCSPFPVCGSCFYCQRNLPMLCEPVTEGHAMGRLPDGRTRLQLDGSPLNHFLAVSSFAEFTVVPEEGAIRIPVEVPFDAACMLGCAVITGVGGALRIAQVQSGDTACVVGCGPIGLNAIQGARFRGASVIFAVDINTDRLELARRFGATHVCDPRAAHVVEEIKRLTKGRGADHSFETAGAEVSLQTSLEATRPGGTVTILGKMPPDAWVSLRFGSLMGERTIRRSSLGGAQAREDIPIMARAYLDGKLLLDELITERIPLAEINEGLGHVSRGETVRTVMKPDFFRKTG